MNSPKKRTPRSEPSFKDLLAKGQGFPTKGVQKAVRASYFGKKAR